VSLRERQASLLRASVLDAAIDALADRSADDVSMADVAAAAGISLRTLYRYFPDRVSLLRAAGEHVYASLGIPFDIEGPETISASLADAAARLSTRPGLARALVQTTAGRAARTGVRGQRVEAIARALKPLVDGLEPEVGMDAAAVITHLCSAASWVIISDESGLSESQAQHAVGWAIDTLVQALQRQRRQAQRAGRGNRQR
jgi:AcrR family transcriptional regulator